MWVLAFSGETLNVDTTYLEMAGREMPLRSLMAPRAVYSENESNRRLTLTMSTNEGWEASAVLAGILSSSDRVEREAVFIFPKTLVTL